MLWQKMHMFYNWKLNDDIETSKNEFPTVLYDV